MSIATRETVNSLRPMGSLVYETAIVALDLPEQMSRALLTDPLKKIGLKPKDLTIELLGTLMPQADESLRLYLPPAEARSAMRRLTAFIIDWEDTSEEIVDFEFDADWECYAAISVEDTE